MRGVKAAVTDQGAQLIPCPGCGHVVRSHPEMEELDADLNWTRTCARCERKLCRVCFPVGFATCGRPDCDAVHAANVAAAKAVALEVAREADVEIEAREEAEAADDKYWEDQ
jgi:hypothetical protein